MGQMHEAIMQPVWPASFQPKWSRDQTLQYLCSPHADPEGPAAAGATNQQLLGRLPHEDSLKTGAAHLTGIGVAVLGVADDGVADERHVAPDLIFALCKAPTVRHQKPIGCNQHRHGMDNAPETAETCRYCTSAQRMPAAAQHPGAACL